MTGIIKNELTKPSLQTQLDGFAGYEDRIEGDDRPQGYAVIQGTIIKLNNEGEWVTNDGDELSSELELVASDVARIVQKWIDQKPEETIIVAPGQKFPDVEEMNKKAPRSEWRENLNGEMVGPWQMQNVLYLVDPETLDKYTYPTSTTGGAIAIRELCDMHMKTRFGGRQRPHFSIKYWVGADIARDGGTAAIVHKVKEPSLKEDLNDDLPDFVK
jgi:hypothetical protein